MPSLKDATKPPANLAQMVEVIQPQNPPAPVLVPREQPGLAVGSLGPAPDAFTTAYDRIRQWFRPGTSQQRFPPLPTKANPQLNAAAASVSKTVAAATVTAAAALSTDDDSIAVNVQTGTQYTVQQSDYNTLISISNAAGGTIYLPPVAGSTSVAVTNSVATPFTSGNSVTVGSKVTSTYIFTATKAIAVGDFMFLAVRNVSSHSDAPIVSMSDNLNGTWAGDSVHIDDAIIGVDTLSLFWVRNTVAVAAGGTVTIQLVATYPGVAFNPDVNEFWTMTGIKNAGGKATNSGLSSGSTFSSGGVAITSPTIFISCADSNNGDISPTNPAASLGISWTTFSASDGAGTFNWAKFPTSGTVNDVYSVSASGHGFIDILQGFNQVTAQDVTNLSGQFYCYIENTGVGSYALISAAQIDGSSAPPTLAQGQGVLLIWDTNTAAWYTERGMGGGGGGSSFYQTVQQAGTSKPQENKLNFLGPITAVDNSGNGSTDIAVPDMVGDSGSGGTHGLVPAPSAGDTAANKFLKASGSFAVPPTMVGDSGSGGVAGYAPAPGAGDNAAGKFLSAGGTYVNPGTNPTSFNTGLAYAIAAGYALG